MNTANEFLIENHVLVKYTGAGGDVAVPEDVTEIGPRAFADAVGLKTVILPESLKKIGADAFLNCSNLENLVIPAGVKTIGGFAFVGCSKLDLTFKGEKTKLAKMSVIDVDCRMVIFGPEGSTAQKYAEEKNLTFIALEA